MQNLLELLKVESINVKELLNVINTYLEKNLIMIYAKKVGDIVIINLLDNIDNSRIVLNGTLSLGDKRLTITAINN